MSHHARNISVYASYPGIIFKSAPFHFQNGSGVIFNWRIQNIYAKQTKIVLWTIVNSSKKMEQRINQSIYNWKWKNYRQGNEKVITLVWTQVLNFSDLF